MSKSPGSSSRGSTPTAKEQRPDALSPTNSSGSTSTIHGPSPLTPTATRSPESTPTFNNVALPSPTITAPASPKSIAKAFSARGNTMSQARSNSPDRSAATPRPGTHPVPGADTRAFPFSALRNRESTPGKSSRAPSPGRLLDLASTMRTDTPTGAPSHDWWDTGAKRTPRGWDVSEPKRKRTIPGEQIVALQNTRQRVAAAAKSVLGNALLVTHEALTLSTDLLQLAPVPGLAEAARTLLNIWDALESVDSNRMACLRLTERCADILSGVRDEIVDAGPSVANEMRDPIAKLVDSFAQVCSFMIKQANRPFLKRYLKRDEILREIQGCDTALSDSLYLFSTSIQIRILKQVQANSQLGQATVNSPVSPLSLSPFGLLGGPLSTSTDTLTPIKFPEPEGAFALPSVTPPNESINIRSKYAEMCAHQNLHDRALDEADLRALMRGAMQAGDDVQLLDVLEVPRPEIPDAIKTLQRALESEVDKERANDASQREEWAASVRSLRTVASVESITSQVSDVPSLTNSVSSSDGSSNSRLRRDTLDREFMECGIDAMRRLSRGTQFSPLPSWTITKYEITRDVKVGVGSFSNVYRGSWRGRTVAIKVLLESTPPEPFKKEIQIWKSLQHRNVLSLFGASSASGDPPYFFVSPYYKNGNLVKFLSGFTTMNGVDALRMLHEIAKGMQYLHSKNVLHGDLKASNVLVDDKGRCIISDFGQSEMKSEAYRRSGTPQHHEGAWRWQAPELMAGKSHLSPEMDVYSFAICCVEILGKGAVPWAVHDDIAVYNLVVELNQRPPIPESRYRTKELDVLIQACWSFDPVARPPFSRIAADIKQIRAKIGGTFDEPTLPPPETIIEEPSNHRSPSTLPIELPEDPTAPPANGGLPRSSVKWPNTVQILPPSTTQPVKSTESPFSRQGSIVLEDAISSDNSSDAGLPIDIDASGYLSPPPENSNMIMTRDERRYRLLLQHEFHPTLILPLWTPSPVVPGAVGFLEKPEGSFKTLFNAFNPSDTSSKRMNNTPSIYGYGRVVKGLQRAEKRNTAQRGFDTIQGWLTKGSHYVSRQYTYQLRTGHKAAFLYTETTVYNYLDNLDAPKKWFKANIDAILKAYGAEHALQKEDVLLVVGTLDAPNHAQYVSHSHPDGQLHFNVFASPAVGSKWGMFVRDTQLSPELLPGPSDTESAVPSVFASKVSDVRRPGPAGWNSVLLARLRFKTDAVDPTSR